MAKTVLQLIGELATFWIRVSGPIVPRGSNYAASSQIAGFEAHFDQFCSEQGLTPQEITDLENGFEFPDLSGAQPD